MTDNEERAALCRRLREHGVTIVSTLCADIEIEKLRRWAGDVAVPGEAAHIALRAAEPEDENPLAYDAMGPRHTTARVPRGMTREAFEPLLIEWTATLDRGADPIKSGGPYQPDASPNLSPLAQEIVEAVDARIAHHLKGFPTAWLEGLAAADPEQPAAPGFAVEAMSAFGLTPTPQIDVKKLCDAIGIDPAAKTLTRNEERAIGYAAMAMVERKNRAARESK
jgi:hypothetical protein